MQHGQFTLAGTLILDGNNMAYLKEAKSNKQHRVKQGEQINGMTVAEIKPDHVRLTLGDEAEELTLRVATNPRPTPAAVVATTPAGTPMPAPPPPRPRRRPGPRTNPTTSRAAAPQPVPLPRPRRQRPRRPPRFPPFPARRSPTRPGATSPSSCRTGRRSGRTRAK